MHIIGTILLGRHPRCLFEELAEETGCFSEMFEIYECGTRPWFTTAEGIFVQAVTELFTEEE